MLFVTPTPGANIDRAALADFLQADVMEPPARPRATEVIIDMPVTPVGKISKLCLREIAAEAAALDVLSVALPGAPAMSQLRTVSVAPTSRLRLSFSQLNNADVLA